MAIEPVPYIDPAPVPGPQRGDESTFDDRMDAKIRWDETSAQQFGDLADNVVHNANEALGGAQAAADQATASQNYANSAAAARDQAVASATNAETARSQAQTAATAAGTARDQAQAAATAAMGAIVTATSTSTNAVGLGDKTFTVPAGKQFIANVPAIAVDSSSPDNYVAGTIKSYSGTTLVITATKFGGSGNISSWNISVAGVQGVKGDQGIPGSIAGGNMAGPLNLKRATDIMGPTPDIWSSGNLCRISTTDAITGFPAAPQAGADRTLWNDTAGTPITASASLIVEGGSTTLRQNDIVRIYAITTTVFVAIIDRADGTAVTAPPVYPPTRNIIVITSTGIYTPLVTGWHRVHLFGATGRSGRSFGPIGRATGAGAPGLSIKWVYLVAGTGYMFVLGAASAAVASATGAIQGVDGGNSTFSAPTGTMTAEGGKAGAASVSGVATLAGGLGGAASGGDLNFTGGRGGNISVTGSPGTANYVATGSGAVAIFGQGYNGGDVTLNLAGTGTTPVVVSTGGAGVKGKGGDVNISVAGGIPSVTIVTAGGGAGGGADTVTTNTATQTAAGVNALGDQSPLQTNQVSATLGATAGGTPSVAVGTALASTAPGGGSAGADISGSANNQVPGGSLAGTGGVVSRTTSGANGLTAPGARFGVSNGGLVAASTAFAAASTGLGFGGFALIESP